ncbi:MAG: Type 1 glutamine amidotransferase-like domain-containing protein [Candidatus Obscuribacterales bacterium]|jgi:cyanophycinase|nr:Type 1 glutamine amidotransferase-like domain-containing protein [Candidatus Obscuribacterales bacterium]
MGRLAFFLALSACFLSLSLSVGRLSAAEEKEPVKAGDIKGTLYLVGGNADTSLKRFAELAGGENALVAIIPHASATPKEAADEFANQLASYGVKKTVEILPGSNGTLPKDVTAVWFTGGDQNRLMRLLDKDLQKAVVKFLEDGGLVGGTSAGAAAAVETMIAGGMEDGKPKAGSLRIGNGLGLLKKRVIDTHSYQYGRPDRIPVYFTMVADVSFGIALDEDTAVEIKGGKAVVYGAGMARVYVRTTDFQSELPKTKTGDMAGIRGVTYSTYSADEEFDL